MKPRYLHSISFRVTFWVSVVAVAIVALHLRLTRPEERFFEIKMNEADRVAGIIRNHLLAEMLSGEPSNIQRHMELLPGDEGIRRVEIYDPEMVVRFSTDKSRLARRIAREEETPCRNCHVEAQEAPERILYDTKEHGRIFAVDRVLHNGPDCRPCHADRGPILGNILVELSLTKEDDSALAVRRRLILVGAFLLVVMLAGMGAIIHLLVGKPAAALVEKMGRIEAGEFDVGAPRRSTDEFGSLDRGFHTMVERLRALYSEMEIKIRERTNALYQTQAQVMHQEKLAGIGQLAAGVAHEIGNPLTAVDSMVQLMAMESEDPKVRDRVRVIQQQVDRISEIVHSMADLSRPLSLEVQTVDVNSVLHSVLGLARYDARFRSIAVRTRFSEALPRVRAVEDRLFGVFLNLALNAADAMPGGGELEITTAAESNDVLVVFRDTGHGIPEEHLDRIFEPYFTTKAPGKGTGLGLSVCRGFLRRLGGDIEVETKIGVGSAFRVRIPIESAPGAGGAS